MFVGTMQLEESLSSGAVHAAIAAGLLADAKAMTKYAGASCSRERRFFVGKHQ